VIEAVLLTLVNAPPIITRPSVWQTTACTAPLAPAWPLRNRAVQRAIGIQPGNAIFGNALTNVKAPPARICPLGCNASASTSPFKTE